MAAYFNSTQLRLSLKEVVADYITECKNCGELNQDCIDLLRHNYLADFVVYNKETRSIEVGINKNELFDGYPEIEIYTFPIEHALKKIDHSFRNNNEDLEFYGRLIGRRKGLGSNSVVVLN
ncbi:hypothetical protein [Gramella sp. AN32]|uniref:Uncharacterized protein n=1 Tax=Christiangramia antarctica TaxID=2058158 RepID=A0ABW5X5K0_9FLAO|nr:hypothetical protein [Gramella sp. AN32]MCM4154829.1 hypothetical protein [Gramella sp. AN32]